VGKKNKKKKHKEMQRAVQDEEGETPIKMSRQRDEI